MKSVVTGLYNFESAIRVAKCDDAQKRGVLAVMNDEIHSARYSHKDAYNECCNFSHANTLGPIGWSQKIEYYSCRNH